MLAGGGGITVADMAGLAARAERRAAPRYLAEAWRSGFVALAAMVGRTERTPPHVSTPTRAPR